MRFKSLLGFLMFVLLSGLFYLQIIKHDYFYRLSEENKIKMIILPAPRGRIFDRDGNVLANVVSGFSAFYTKPFLTKKEKEKLAKIFHISPKDIDNRMRKNPTILKRKLTPYELSQLSEIKDELPDIRIMEYPIRYYPYGKMFSHLIGYVGEIKGGELKNLRFKGYQMGDEIGKMGVEKYYEDFLRGSKGVEYIEVNAKGYEIGIYKDKPPVLPQKGNDVYLTVSLPLQEYAESLMSSYKKGALVAMDPKSGEILAYISIPQFDPNLLTTGINPELWAELQSDTLSPMFDRVIKGAYPPGSIFKIITAGVGLEDKIVNQYSRFLACTGKLIIGNRVFRCWKAHGSLDLTNAIIQSCDIYFYQLAMKIGITRLSQGALSMGLGKPTGIDLNGEVSGFIPDSTWLNKKYGKYGWSKGTIANIGIGQGEVLLTPIQIATVISAIANNGSTYPPHILKKIVDNHGNIINMWTGKEIHIPLSQNTIKILKQAMRGVVQDSMGTAHFWNIKGLDIGGKTGTAQNPMGKDHSLFVGFAPVDNPQIVAFAILENAGHGSSHAAPVVIKLIKYYLTHKK